MVACSTSDNMHVACYIDVWYWHVVLVGRNGGTMEPQAATAVDKVG